MLKVKDLPAHLTQCQFVKRVCPNIGCDLRFSQVELAAHETECGHATVKCQWCVVRDKRMSIATHEAVCPNTPVRCPNIGCECPDLLPSSSYQRRYHKKNCMFEIIDCSYESTIGCTHRCIRRDMGAHESNVTAHFVGLMNKVEEYQTELTSQRETIDEQNETIVEQNETIAKLEESLKWTKVECLLHLNYHESKQMIPSEEFVVAGYKFRLELHLNQTGVDKNYAGLFLALTHGFGGVTVKALTGLLKEGKETKMFTLKPTVYGEVTEAEAENGVDKFERGTRRFVLRSELADYAEKNILKLKVQVALSNPSLPYM